MNRIRALLLATGVALSLVGVAAIPASASPTVCVSISDHGTTYPVQYYSHYTKTATGLTTGERAGCYTFAVKGTGVPNEFYFQVEAQDTIDVAYNGYTSQDVGVTRVQYRTPGSNVWHDWTLDQDSADWNVAWGTSQVYNIITNGRPEQFVFRIQRTQQLISPGGVVFNGTPWYSPSNIVSW